MRGGDGCPALAIKSTTGRSPHARGRLYWITNEQGKRGSIPACAGETSATLSPCCFARVDPRMRGGDPMTPASIQCAPGRSPHARGRRTTLANDRYNRGSIPACAGETHEQARRDRPDWVDPRMRGGDPVQDYRANLPEGRSPHARGRRGGRPRVLPRVRSIPACAGETCLNGLLLGVLGVDPRMRGGDPAINGPPKPA